MFRPSGIALRAACALVVLLYAAVEARAEKYKILVTDARISPKKQLANGKQEPWDIGANGVEKPDPYVVIDIGDGPVFASGTEHDTLFPRWFTGTGYWSVDKSTKVKIKVRDADAGKLFARVGIAGITIRNDVPNFGKRFLNDVLLGVDTDDTIAVWTGTLGELMGACGGANRSGDIVRAFGAKNRLSENIGLESLTVRVIERPDAFDLYGGFNKSYIGLTGATFEAKKRGIKAVWDVGLGAVQNPDPRYFVYVNGEPVVTGAVNKDSFVAVWEGELPGLNLHDDDTIAISVLDADAGTLVAGTGKHGVLFHPGLSDTAKKQLFEELNKASTDDLAFLWVGSWRDLRAKGEKFELAGTPAVAGTWYNDGVSTVTAVTANKKPVIGGGVPVPVTLTVKGATIKATKANGAAWDAGFGNVVRPDPFVKCFVSSPIGGWELVGTSKTVKDSYTATWDLRVADKRLLPGRKLKFEVYDEDVASNDLIGTIVITIPDGADSGTVSGDQIQALDYKTERP